MIISSNYTFCLTRERRHVVIITRKWRRSLCQLQVGCHCRYYIFSCIYSGLVCLAPLPSLPSPPPLSVSLFKFAIMYLAVCILSRLVPLWARAEPSEIKNLSCLLSLSLSLSLSVILLTLFFFKMVGLLYNNKNPKYRRIFKILKRLTWQSSTRVSGVKASCVMGRGVERREK